MTLDAELFGRGRQQQQAWNRSGKSLDAIVSRRGMFRRPLEMVGFVDDQQVPISGAGLLVSVRMVDQKAKAGQNELCGFKRIGLARGFEFFADLIVEDGKPQVEATQHLDQPLMDQVRRHHDECPIDAAVQQEPVQDQTGLDSFAKPHFIGQQNARRVTAGYFVGDVKLVPQQLDARPHQAEYGGNPMAVLMTEGVAAQAKAARFVDLPGKQPVERAVELHEAVQIDLVQADRPAACVDALVDDAPFDFLDRLNDDLRTVLAADPVGRAVLNARQGGVVQGIGPAFVARREIHDDVPVLHLEHDAEAEFGLGITDPALSGMAFGHELKRRTFLSGTVVE